MRWEWRGKRVSAYHWVPAPSEVAEALGSLYRRVQSELEDYRSFAQERQATACVARADQSLSWVATRGREMVDALREVATVASPAPRLHLVEAAKALIALADIGRERDMSDFRNRDMLRDWAEQALPTLKAAIESFVDSEETDAEDWSEGEPEVSLLVGQETGPPRYVAEVKGCAPQAAYLVAA